MRATASQPSPAHDLVPGLSQSRAGSATRLSSVARRRRRVGSRRPRRSPPPCRRRCGPDAVGGAGEACGGVVVPAINPRRGGIRAPAGARIPVADRQAEDRCGRSLAIPGEHGARADGSALSRVAGDAEPPAYKTRCVIVVDDEAPAGLPADGAAVGLPRRQGRAVGVQGVRGLLQELHGLLAVASGVDAVPETAVDIIPAWPRGGPGPAGGHPGMGRGALPAGHRPIPTSGLFFTRSTSSM